MIYQIDTKVWASPKQYAEERNVTKQVVHWWMTNNQLEVKHLEEYGLKLIKRGSEKGSAKPEVQTDTESTRSVSKYKNKKYKKNAQPA